MISEKEFKIFSIQYSMFTPALIFSMNKILGEIMNSFSKEFNGNTTSIPLPDNAPKEFPRIIFTSSDKKLKMEIALNRVNLFNFILPDEESIDEAEFFNFAITIQKKYVECCSAKIGRLALVMTKYIYNDNPGLALANHFCKERWLKEPFNRPETFNIQSHKKYKYENFNINSWVKCNSGLINNNQPAILIEQDINTLAEEIDKLDFNEKNAKKFLNSINKEQISILQKYFPIQ